MVISLIYDKYKKILRQLLDDYRYKHSLCVADQALHLANRYGADPHKAYLAGLLHDITKNYSYEEHLKIFNTFDIITSDIEKCSVKLWHAISGAVYIKEYLNIDDLDIISAVRYHTTGKSNMTLLEKVIYVADFTSSDRSYPDVDVMRKLSDDSLEEAMIYALRHTITDLLQKGSVVHPDTLDAYNFLISNNS